MKARSIAYEINTYRLLDCSDVVIIPNSVSASQKKKTLLGRNNWKL